MRNGQKQRMRGRNRKGQNPLTRVYESNGPDVKIRGTASHIAEKYVQLARDAQSSGDPVAAENYYQHAEHYFRLIAAVQEQFRQSQPYFRDADSREGYEESDDEGVESPPGTGEPHAPREQAQPYGGREAQPYGQREPRFQPREREQAQPYQSRQPQPNIAADEGGDIDRLPAFVTGGAPQPSPNGGHGANGFEGSPDRFPLHRRRRRRHAPRETSSGPGEAGEPAPRPVGD